MNNTEQLYLGRGTNWNLEFDKKKLAGYKSVVILQISNKWNPDWPLCDTFFSAHAQRLAYSTFQLQELMNHWNATRAFESNCLQDGSLDSSQWRELSCLLWVCKFLSQPSQYKRMFWVVLSSVVSCTRILWISKDMERSDTTYNNQKLSLRVLTMNQHVSLGLTWFCSHALTAAF